MISYKDIDIRKASDRVLYVLDQASDRDIIDGSQWYNNARSFAGQLSNDYRVPINRIIGVISALSPGTNWAKNKIDTRSILEEGDQAIVSTYNKNKIKALDILAGIRVPDQALGSKKTGAFYQNILHPDDRTRVTIDRHSSRCAHGYHMTPDQAIKYANTDRKYRTSEEVYYLASDRVPSLLPHQLQAITWLVYRRVYIDRIIPDA